MTRGQWERASHLEREARERLERGKIIVQLFEAAGCEEREAADFVRAGYTPLAAAAVLLGRLRRARLAEREERSAQTPQAAQTAADRAAQILDLCQLARVPGEAAGLVAADMSSHAVAQMLILRLAAPRPAMPTPVGEHAVLLSALADLAAELAAGREAPRRFELDVSAEGRRVAVQTWRAPRLSAMEPGPDVLSPKDAPHEGAPHQAAAGVCDPVSA